MPRRAFRLAASTLFAFIGYLPVHGQPAPEQPARCVSSTDNETKAIFEIGAATSWETSGGAPIFAPNVAVEIEPVKNWLELEAGISPFYTHTAQEWDTDLLLKKPWTLSRKAEFMFGIGPQWVHYKRSGGWTDTLSGEVAGDFMFWPTGKHTFGWYVEPAFDYSFAGGHQKSLGISFGLLIGIH